MKTKYPPPKYFRLSPEAKRILEEIGEDLGDIGERSALEVLARFARGLKQKTGLPYTEILLKTDLSDVPGYPHFDGRRKHPRAKTAALSAGA